jgi:hypothetical protein
MTVPTVGHLEAQPGGCCTLRPYFIHNLIELPLTTTQDYSLFHILNNYSIDLWKQQIDTITARHGLVSFIVHPDYVKEKRPQDTYKALLEYLSKLRAEERIWIAKPGEVAGWWRRRHAMTLSRSAEGWVVRGEGYEDACIASAYLTEDGSLAYRYGKSADAVETVAQ